MVQLTSYEMDIRIGVLLETIINHEVNDRNSVSAAEYKSVASIFSYCLKGTKLETKITNSHLNGAPVAIVKGSIRDAFNSTHFNSKFYEEDVQDVVSALNRYYDMVKNEEKRKEALKVQESVKKESVNKEETNTKEEETIRSKMASKLNSKKEESNTKEKTHTKEEETIRSKMASKLNSKKEETHTKESNTKESNAKEETHTKESNTKEKTKDYLNDLSHKVTKLYDNINQCIVKSDYSGIISNLEEFQKIIESARNNISKDIVDSIERIILIQPGIKELGINSVNDLIEYAKEQLEKIDGKDIFKQQPQEEPEVKKTQKEIKIGDLGNDQSTSIDIEGLMDRQKEEFKDNSKKVIYPRFAGDALNGWIQFFHMELNQDPTKKEMIKFIKEKMNKYEAILNDEASKTSIYLNDKKDSINKLFENVKLNLSDREELVDAQIVETLINAVTEAINKNQINKSELATVIGSLNSFENIFLGLM